MGSHPLGTTALGSGPKKRISLSFSANPRVIYNLVRDLVVYLTRRTVTVRVSAFEREMTAPALYRSTDLKAINLDRTLVVASNRV